MFLSLATLICMMVNINPSINLFVYWQIMFPFNLNFICLNVLNAGLIANSYISFELGQISRVINQVNKINILCFSLQLIYFLVYEIYKMSFAPRFFYGNLGTSIESKEDNGGYSNGMQPMWLIYIFASVSLTSLIGLYTVALANCYFIGEWLSHSKAVRDYRARKVPKYLSLKRNSHD